jgi:hypothetical protein
MLSNVYNVANLHNKKNLNEKSIGFFYIILTKGLFRRGKGKISPQFNLINWRTTSHKTTPPATETFKECLVPN